MIEHQSGKLSQLAPLPRLNHNDFMLPDEQISPEQIAAWRAMTGAHRWRLAEGLYQSARKLKLAGLRAQHPDWPEEQLADELRRILRHART